MYSFDRQKWCALIKLNNSWKFIGYYNDEREAALAYDKCAIKYNMKCNILIPKELYDRIKD